MTTRNRLQASQAQNRSVGRPSITGPLPQSNWSHMPGSVIHGRYVRRRPARYAVLASRTARRVVRSVPSKPRAASRSWTMSARTLPAERSTSSSIFGRYGSIFIGRRDPGGRVVAPVTPVDVAGDRLRIAGGEVGRRMGAAGEIERFEDLHDLPVRLLHGPSGSGDDLGVGTPQGSPSRGDRDGRDWMARGDQLSADREISCPSARKSVSAYREIGMSAVIRRSGAERIRTRSRRPTGRWRPPIRRSRSTVAIATTGTGPSSRSWCPRASLGPGDPAASPAMRPEEPDVCAMGEASSSGRTGQWRGVQDVFQTSAVHTASIVSPSG